MDSDGTGEGNLYLPVTGSRFYLIGRECPDHTERNNFESKRGLGSGIFVLSSMSEALRLFISRASHTFEYNPMSVKKNLVDLLRLEELTLPTYSVLVGHGLLQNI